MNRFFVKDSKFADELIKLDFPEGLYTSPKDCKNYYEHCKKYNMKWLNGSYGSIVHKDFNKYFKYIPIRNDNEYEIQQKLTCKKGLDADYSIEGVNLDLDHVNLFKSRLIEDVYFVSSSPYKSLSVGYIKCLEKYPYGSYIIHPNLLDYHAFVNHDLRHPLMDMTYIFTNATYDEIRVISEQIYNSIKCALPPFLSLGGYNGY